MVLKMDPPKYLVTLSKGLSVRGCHPSMLMFHMKTVKNYAHYIDIIIILIIPHHKTFMGTSYLLTFLPREVSEH